MEPPDDLPIDARIMTVKELCEVWWAEYSERKDVTEKTLIARDSTGKRIRDALGDRALSSLDDAALARWRDKQLNRYASQTVRQSYELLKQIWRWGVKRKLLHRDCPEVTVRVTRARERYIPSKAEVEAVRKALDVRTKRHRYRRTRWAYYAYRVLAGTGMRVGACAALTWADLDETVPALNVVRGKSGSRQVVMPASLLTDLRAWRVESGRVGGRIWPVSAVDMGRILIVSHIAPSCAEAKVPRFTNHSLRNYVEQQMIVAGVPIDVVTVHMGHSPAVALRHYLRPTTVARRDAIQKAGLG